MKKLLTIMAAAAMTITASAETASFGSATYSEGQEEAATFEWVPAGLTPYPTMDLIYLSSLATVNFSVYGVDGVTLTDVMPVWLDEDGNEVAKAFNAVQDPWEWDPNDFQYEFKTDAFKANGEYILLFPEGMLVNAAGEKSAKIMNPYTVAIPELDPPMFSDFKVLSIDPDFSKPQSVWSDRVITINTNHNEAIGYTKIVVTDITTGDFIFQSSNHNPERQLGETSEISFEMTGTYKFFEDHTYKAEIIFYNGPTDYDYETWTPTKIVDRVSYEFTGLLESYKYSSVKLLNVSPTPWGMISEPSEAVFTYTFSGPVNVYKAVTPLGLNGLINYSQYLSSNEDKTVWTLDLSKDEEVQKIDTQLTILVYARDLEGYQVKGNNNEEGENSGFEYNWNCELGALPIVVVSPEKGQSLDRLDKIVVKSVDGKPMAWSWTGEAYVLDQLGLILGTLVYPESDGEGEALLDEIVFTSWADDFGVVSPIDLVEEGSYAIRFSAGCFNFGEQFDDAKSRSLTSTFSITGALDEPEPGIDPAEQEVFNYDRVSPASGSNIESLSQIQLWFPDVVACEEFTVNVYNTADQSIVTTGTGLYSWDDWTLIEINFAQPVTENGTYEVVIPARTIYTADFEDGQVGICNPEFKLTYIIGNGSAVSAVEAADADAEYYDLTGRRVLNPSKGIYIVNGKKVIK